MGCANDHPCYSFGELLSNHTTFNGKANVQEGLLTSVHQTTVILQYKSFRNKTKTHQLILKILNRNEIVVIEGP